MVLQEDLIRLADIALRSLISAIVLFIMTKLMGKKQISQLSIFDYVVGITIGSIAAAMAVDQDTEYVDALLSLIIYSGLSILISYSSMKSYKARIFLTGTPTILIQNGKILKQNLRKMKLDLHDLLEECRVSGYFDINDIEFAIMETSGNISFLPKSEKRPVLAEDMNLSNVTQGLCANVIVDGEIMHGILQVMKKDEKWLLEQLKKQGLQPKDVDGIFLATLSPEGDLSVHMKHVNTKVYDVLE